MSKLQKIIRLDKSSVYSVNIPKEMIEETTWEKGDELEFETVGIIVGEKYLIIRRVKHGFNR